MKPEDPPRGIHWRPRLVGIGLGALALLLAALFQRFPGFSERIYATGIGPWIGWISSRLTGWLPFSLAELLLALLVARQLELIVRAVRGGVRRRWHGSAVADGALRVVQDTGVVIFLFYVTWGFHYARPALEERWHWSEQADAPIEVEELERLGRQFMTLTNEAYRELHGTEDAQAPTPAPDSLTELNEAVEQSWQTLCTALDLPSARRLQHGGVKRPWIAPVLCRFGVSGFYFPWTGEANVNRRLPGMSIPHSIAHEKAHQRGFAPENEANFLGYLAGASCDHPLARYAARLFAQRQLIRALERARPGEGVALIADRLPGVQRDVDDMAHFWAQYRGTMRRIGHRSNDLYLRSNRVAGGTLSYARSVELLVRYARENEGNPLPPPAP